MNTSSSPPLSVRAQRVLLWTMAVITFLNAWVAFLEAGGGPFGIGYVLPHAALGVFLAVLATKLVHAKRWVRTGVVVVHVCVLLLEFLRFGSGDPLGLVGMLFAVVGLVLIFRRTACAFFT